ncbi:MAG: hypothetical protein ACU0CA_12385 [Paracoccaceae bacterium]
MQSIDSALLFVGTPTLALEHFGESLNARLQSLGIQFENSSSPANEYAAFSAPGIELVVKAHACALPAESFTGSLDSPLSSPFRGMLSNILFRHGRHMVLSVIPEFTEGSDAPEVDRLTLLRVAHAATVLLTEWHQPAAVHWRQSNQLLLGSQYLKLATDSTPWALFAHARVISENGIDRAERREGVRLDEAIELIGRPIVFKPTDRPLEEVHAAALSFLRYTLENGAPIPDGHTFGPEDGKAVKVTHVEPSTDIPLGGYELNAHDIEAQAFVSLRPSAVAGRADEISVEPPQAYIPEKPQVAPAPKRFSKSRIVGFLMLLVMPPIGLAMLVSNALFGENPWRTGLIATASVALALLVSAFTFLNYVGQETAVFIDPLPIQATVLQE